MLPRPPRSTLTHTLFPYPTLFLSPARTPPVRPPAPPACHKQARPVPQPREEARLATRRRCLPWRGACVQGQVAHGLHADPQSRAHLQPRQRSKSSPLAREPLPKENSTSLAALPKRVRRSTVEAAV